MDKCTYCAGGPEADSTPAEYAKYGANRLAEGKLPICAEMCSTKSLLAGDGEIIAEIYKERVMKRSYGSGAWGWDYCLSRGHRSLSSLAGTAARHWRITMTTRPVRIRSFVIIAFCSPDDDRGKSSARAATRPGWRAQPNRERSERATATTAITTIEGPIPPNERARVLTQPAGRQWDHFHEITLRWLGAIVILGMIVALGAAYLIMGRLRISKGRSGHKVLRFNAFERFSHWLTAVSFVVLGLTGLNITFGKLMLLPMIGPEAFSSLSQAAKYVYNFVSAAFVIGLVLIVALWIKDNIPRKVDVGWVKQGGGFIKSKHAPSGRFNAGEKLVFWFSVGAGVAVIISGYLLIFPFMWLISLGCRSRRSYTP